jgi:hypothetical protein
MEHSSLNLVVIASGISYLGSRTWAWNGRQRWLLQPPRAEQGYSTTAPQPRHKELDGLAELKGDKPICELIRSRSIEADPVHQTRSQRRGWGLEDRVNQVILKSL